MMTLFEKVYFTLEQLVQRNVGIFPLSIDLFIKRGTGTDLQRQSPLNRRTVTTV